MIATRVATDAAAGYHVRPVVALAFCGPFEVEGQIDGNGEYVDVCSVFARSTDNRPSALGLVVNGSAREEQTRTESQVEVFAQTQVRHKTYMKAGQECTDTSMVDINVARNGIRDRQFAVRDLESTEVDSQLETEVEELVIRIRSVLRYLCRA